MLKIVSENFIHALLLFLGLFLKISRWVPLYQLSFPQFTMAQEGQSPVLVFDSPVMVLHSLVLVFTESSFNFYRVQFWFLHSPVLFF